MIKIGDKIIFIGKKYKNSNESDNLSFGMELEVTDVYKHNQTIECVMYNGRIIMLSENEYKLKENNVMTNTDITHPNFKPGDYVLCTETCQSLNIEKNKVYKIESVDSVFVYLVGVKYPVSFTRFKKCSKPLYKVYIKNDNHPDKVEIVLETSSSELANDLAVNLYMVFNKFEYKTFKCYIQKENEL